MKIPENELRRANNKEMVNVFKMVWFEFLKNLGPFSSAHILSTCLFLVQSFTAIYSGGQFEIDTCAHAGLQKCSVECSLHRIRQAGNNL